MGGSAPSLHREFTELSDIMTTKDRLFVGGLVHEHMCETAFLAVIHGKHVWPPSTLCTKTMNSRLLVTIQCA